ncbi:polynucleotide kinase [Salmonella enterica subsp. arizonae]|nr:polynucleotide kinase [Salmonella enterica subsp. arizonae]
MKFELWGETYNIDGATKGVVIVDLDGTLSNGMHRLHLLPTKDLHLTESWSEFNRAAIGDSPIQDTIDVVNGLWVSGFSVIILTGRSDEVARETYSWLDKYRVKYDYLIMRRCADNRKDTIIKEEVLRAIGLENIVCAFDDSPGVIAHIRNLGLTVYQVNQYDKQYTHIGSHGVEKLSVGVKFLGSDDCDINECFTTDKVYISEFSWTVRGNRYYHVFDDHGEEWAVDACDHDFDVQ